MTEQLIAEVTFHIDLGAIPALKQKAADIDEGGEEDPSPDDYTVAQAFTVVWHLEPEWIHEHVLDGWTLDRAADVDGIMHDVWPRR